MKNMFITPFKLLLPVLCMFFAINFIKFSFTVYALEKSFQDFLKNRFYGFSNLYKDEKNSEEYWLLILDKSKIDLNSLNNSIVKIRNNTTQIEHSFNEKNILKVDENIIKIIKPNDSDCLGEVTYSINIDGLKYKGGNRVRIYHKFTVRNKEYLKCAQEYGIKSKIYRIDYKNKIIKGIHPGTTVGQAIANISRKNFIIFAKKSNGEPLKSSSKLASGDIFDFGDRHGNNIRFHIAVTGDLVGRGVTGDNDRLSKDGIVLLEKYLLGEINLREPYLSAADFDGNGKVDSSDLLFVQKNY